MSTGATKILKLKVSCIFILKRIDAIRIRLRNLGWRVLLLRPDLLPRRCSVRTSDLCRHSTLIGGRMPAAHCLFPRGVNG